LKRQNVSGNVSDSLMSIAIITAVVALQLQAFAAAALLKMLIVIQEHALSLLQPKISPMVTV
jgi:hypothetical protein